MEFAINIVVSGRSFMKTAQEKYKMNYMDAKIVDNSVKLDNIKENKR